MLNRFVALVAFAISFGASANSLGVVGFSGLQGSNCGACHNGGGAPTVSITGPATLVAGASGNYTLNVNGGGSRTGFNVAVNNTSAKLNPNGGSVGLSFGEVHQSSPQNGGSFSYPFTLTAPPFTATLTIYGCGLAVNGNGGTTGDGAGTTTFTVTVTAGSGANPPTITGNTFTVPSPVTTRTVALSVAANDDGPGEPGLSYTWSATGPSAVGFSPNGNNAAKAPTATFVTAGSYMVTIVARDGLNNTATVTLPVTVSAAYSRIRLTPTAVNVPVNGYQQFTASARDQFDAPLAVQPTFTWSVPGGGGSVTTAGMLHAQPAQASGPFLVQVSATVASDTFAAASSFAVGSAVVSTDVTPPVATLTAPAPGSDLIDGLVLQATATDDIGVEKVEFLVANQKVGEDNSPPYQVTYATVATLPPGDQILEARAVDLSNNSARSLGITVKVPDSGTTGGGPDAGTGTPTGDCSCDASGASVPLLALAVAHWIARRRRAIAGS